MVKVLKTVTVVIAVLIVALAGTAYWVLSWPGFGGTLEGERRERASKSPRYDGEHFQNDPPPPPMDLSTQFEEMMGDQVRRPPGPFPSEKPELAEPPRPGLRAFWFGHATVLVEIDGVRVMTDPMLTDYAFPVHLVAPKRFNPPPLVLDALPPIEVVTISHDHFDHLDMETIQGLAEQGTHFFAGLGVGAHLEVWGVPQEQIHEMDWWDSETFAGLQIHCTPARHYSGRTSMNNSTLWASWVLEGPEHRVFHSGDTGYGPHFRAIGERLGPIDLSLIKIGDYGRDKAWLDIHMSPESSIQAHLDLGARTLLPIHWGTFELSFHDWNEPIERAWRAARENGVELVAPKLGQAFVYGSAFENERWWEELESR